MSGFIIHLLGGFEMNAQKNAQAAKALIDDLVSWIVKNDPSYVNNVVQMYRAFEVIDNLERYATAIKDRQEQ